MEQMNTFAVIGGGSWATAIVKMLTENNNMVIWYMRNSEAIKHIEEEFHNPNYLSAVSFDLKYLKLTDQIDQALNGADCIVFAIPSAFLVAEMAKSSTALKNKIVFSAIKGIIPESGKIVGEHLHETHGIPLEQIGIITGPCHAEEVALERLSFLTIACANLETATQMSKALQSSYIKTKISDDIIGAEYAAVLKNIYAIAAGIAHGLGYGDNFQAVLMSNAIREMKRFIKKVYKMKRNINDTAYLGDLLVTGYSVFSRNRMFGNMIGKGYTVKSATMEMNMVAEGYYASKSAFEIMEKEGKSEKTPIINAVYEILYHHKNPKKTFKNLVEELD
ncbi:NAD(P)H-dependent glycerol-3-phosphate dehydrogenase [Flavobacteriaceae bacterium]|nr:NAD(P)H-dependent glycerol-3-phosphate dehydrogenase [Flavobacteriaceae bacterium]